jgi:hypothetical protein
MTRRLILDDAPVTMRDVDDRLSEFYDDEIDVTVGEMLRHADMVKAHHEDIAEMSERIDDLAGQLRAALARVDAITPCPCQTSVYVALPLRDDERPTG